MPYMVHINFLKDNITWVASNVLVALEALVAEALELKNCLLWFGCTPKELQAKVSGLADWISNSSQPW